MSRVARKILFLAFVAAFLVLAPLLVLYTAGFRYNLQNGSLVRTGVISVTTAPRNAEIFVNDVSTDKFTPFVVKQLMPGEYTVRLEREDYHPWIGDVEVRSSETTIIENIVLLRNDAPEALLEEAMRSITPHPDGELVAYVVTKAGWDELWFFNVRQEDSQLVHRIPTTAGITHDLSWSADGSYLLLDSSNDTYLVFEESGGRVGEGTEDDENGASRFWHPSDDNILYIGFEDMLQQRDIDSGETTTFVEEQVDTVLIDASLLRFVDNGVNTEVQQIVGEEAELIALLPRAEYDVVERDGPFLLLTDHRSNLVLLDINAAEPLLLDARAQLFDWLPEQKLLLYSDAHEVNVYDPKTHSIEFITRQGAAIEFVEWHPTGNMVLLASADKITAIETFKTAMERQVTTLIENTPVGSFWVAENGKNAYFYSDATLFELRLTR